jgi:hypothetical protein
LNHLVSKTNLKNESDESTVVLEEKYIELKNMSSKEAKSGDYLSFIYYSAITTEHKKVCKITKSDTVVIIHHLMVWLFKGKFS